MTSMPPPAWAMRRAESYIARVEREDTRYRAAMIPLLLNVARRGRKKLAPTPRHCRLLPEEWTRLPNPNRLALDVRVEPGPALKIFEATVGYAENLRYPTWVLTEPGIALSVVGLEWGPDAWTIRPRPLVAVSRHAIARRLQRAAGEVHDHQLAAEFLALIRSYESLLSNGSRSTIAVEHGHWGLEPFGDTVLARTFIGRLRHD